MAASPPSHLSRIGRVMITVADQTRALAFYADVLGFEVRADFPFGTDRWIEVAIPGTETAITLNGPDFGETPGGTTGLSFETRDIDALHRHLVAAGVDVDPAVQRLGGPVPPRFTFRDPDGNVLDVAETD
jgi:catechol 2,3-dioxygenase-like lactoylglutathione lyase family enzyme